MGRARGALLGLALLGALPVGAETTASVYVGVSFSRPSTLRLRQEGGTDLRLRGVSWASHSFESPVYYGLRVTHFPSGWPGWGLMLDFFHDKVYADPAQRVQVRGTRRGARVEGEEPIGTTLSRFNMSHGTNHLTLNVLYRFGGCEEERCPTRPRPYVGAGAGVLIPHVEATLEEGRVDAYQLTGPSLQLTGGLTSPYLWRAALFGEYRFTYARASADVPGGTVGTRLSTHHLVAGPTFRLPLP